MNEVEVKSNERYIINLEKHLESAKASANYSADRFDILIITISTTALLVTINSSDKFIEENIFVNTKLLAISWFFLVASIILNLISQQTSYYAHIFDIKVTKNLIRKERGMALIANHEINENKHLILNRTTECLNILSLLTLLIGIILIVLFYSKYL